MGTRTVRLDDEAEKVLQEIRKDTGMTISQALKRGLLVLRERVLAERRKDAWAVYERIDLGEGGYAVAPAKNARRAIRDAIRRKHRR